MKKILFIFLIWSFTSCSLSDQSQAENLVKDYLNKNLNDPDSYEPVSFGALKANFDTYENSNTEGKKLSTKRTDQDSIANIYESKIDSINNGYISGKKLLEKYTSLAKKHRHNADSIKQIIDTKSADYHGPLLGYSITHTFRAKNAFGALVLQTKDFMLDDKLTEAY
ncbi:hypothetical protein [Mucilaginibacter ginsenosidivorax]|uniref:Uncharacterized protein n=1 Tax=Mucilaginibacter ginsenosidivorax TaxID=862126 RepID=A0A5B8W6M1_9SPHI|nr:hypothetical protein [Mucilaginibacter ginsenosidivorax]QEC77898.1 hypothetical protein FSB76_18860 [Mucilaginibacter ginsenosidivorax]